MNEQIKEIAGILIATVLIMDGLLHTYWTTGQTWPVRDKLALAQVVLNTNRIRAIRPATLIPLVILLFGGAFIVLARVHQLGLFGQFIPSPLLQAGILVLAAGFFLRGVAGIGWILWRSSAKSKLFYRINLVVYTPLCLVLFIAAVAAALA